MTHEEFLNSLFAANAGPTSPSIWGLTEEEAVSRWLAWLVMCYIRIAYPAAVRSGLESSVVEQIGSLNYVPAKNFPVPRCRHRQAHVCSIAC